ncbi:hypothetical protein HELRODRAFT_166883 [Helobdella robusta]|uniref:Uncharacterized protein n=1 Tax=Helobdella robusta TaxID=6412 RepID=T1EYP8_HELRO|nr:hypothetical protein HELRODRAFT_166883 [Helobdella robusta]ESO11829.1 hypothetical protein HELRODRAFT_166883 [Helobdella robusta]
MATLERKQMASTTYIHSGFGYGERYEDGNRILEFAETKITPCHHPPTIYILNVTCIVKPHAIEHLHPDIIIIITESWLRPDHPDGLIAIDGYTPFRKDRPGSRR